MKTRGNYLPSITVAFLALTLLATAAFAVPQTINYQGYIEGSGGTPVNGSLSMMFSIYNAPTGGSTLWTETQSTVTVTDGVFSVVLGSLTPINLPFDKQYYLGVKVESDAEMAPRAVLVSVPYAMRAGAADTAAYAATAGSADTAVSAQTADSAVTLDDKTLSQIVSILDGRYGVGNALFADFTADRTVVALNETVNFTSLIQGVPIALSWDFGDTGTSALQNPSHEYTTGGTYTVSLTVDDGVTQNTATKTDYITYYPFPRGTITTVDSVGVVGFHTSIAIGADNMPVISYYDVTNWDLKVLYCGDTSCSSGNKTTTVDSVGNVGQYTSIAIGADDLPIISYHDATNHTLKVAHCENADCSLVDAITTVDSEAYVGSFSSIAIGADNLPVISYYDATNQDLRVAHCGISNCTSGNTITTVDSGGNVGQYTSIAIGADDLPIISYNDITNFDLKVAHCGIANCSLVDAITTVDSAGFVGLYTSIAIGADDLPVISYFDNSNSDVKVAHCGVTNCSTGNTTTTVDSAGNVGQYISIAIGGDNVPVVSYYDMVNADLKVAHCWDPACSSGNDIATIDSVESVGQYSSIAMGADDLPVISYFYSTNGDLRVAQCGDAACTLWP